MRIFSRYFTDVKTLLAGVEPQTFFQIHGFRCALEPHCVIVELCLCADLPFDALPALLFATHSLYSRSQLSCKLVIIIDAQRCASPSGILSVSTALCSFCSSCHGLIERVYWVGVSSPSEVQLSISKDLCSDSIENVFVESAADLKQYLDGACCSTSLDGLIDVDTAQQFFKMRYCLEEFLKKTHRIAKLYMNLHDELRQFMSTNGICSTSCEEICNKEDDLNKRWSTVKDDPDCVSLLNDGTNICNELMTKFPLLESCDPFLYSDAVKQAVKAFEEVMIVMKRSDATIKKRLRALENARDTMEFFEFKKNASIQLKVDLHEMERTVAVKTFNVNRLSVQVEKVKKTWERIRAHILDGTSKSAKMRHILEEECTFAESDRNEMQHDVDDFLDALESYRKRSDEILNLSSQVLETRHSIDKVYDWALSFAKKGGDQAETGELLSSFPVDSVRNLKESLERGSLDENIIKEMHSLLTDVVTSMKKLTQDPTWNLENIPSVSGQLVHERKESPLSNGTSGVSSQELPPFAENGVMNSQLGFEDRLSLLFNSASLSSSFTSLPSSNDHSTASLISPNGDQGAGDMVFPSERSRQMRSLTTELVKANRLNGLSPFHPLSSGNALMPEKLNSTNSEGTLLSNDVLDSNPSIIDAYAAKQNGFLEPGDDDVRRARSSSPAPTQYEVPISKSANTSNTSDNAEPEQDLEDELDCEEETEIRWRRNSWSSLPRADDSLSGDERAIGAAPVTLDLTDKVITCMSSNTLNKRLGQRRSVSGFPARLPNPFLINGVARPGSARFSTYKTRPTLSRLFPLEPIEQDRFSIASSFRLSGDESSFTSETIYSNLSPAISTVDFSLRPEQIEYIRESLNPCKTSNANFRIECTVVRDMLNSEIDYVGSLRTVVQDFVPEMSRSDLPVMLRGKKIRLFGNIEKLFQFHAHTFLPQLISRLRFRPIEESLSLTVGSLFVEHAASFSLYSLYAKNKPKADVLMRESGSAFFSSVRASKDLSNLLVRPIERMGKYTLALQQLLNATSPSKMEVLEVLQKAVSVVGCQIRHGADLLAMERITGCDLNLREQGTLLRNDTMFVTEKRGIYAKKRLRSVFLFTNCVVITKPRLRKDSGGRSYDELRYKGSIQMTDCGLTEMVKTSKTKFELWFRKQTASFTYVLETQSPSVRDLWVDDIRNLLWKQAIKSREDSLREKANMGIDSSVASLIPVAPVSPPVIMRCREYIEGTRRPCSLISLTASSCSSSNNATLRAANAHGFGTGEVMAGDLDRVEEIDEPEVHSKDYGCTLPRFNAPPPPVED